MVRTHHIVGALAAAGLLLTGCSSGFTAATPASSSTSSSTTSPAPSSSSSTVAPSSPTTKPTPKGDPNVPPAARAHTKAGAEAFTRAYVDLLNTSGIRPSPTLIAALSLPECKTCQNFVKSFATLHNRKQRVSGPVMKVLSFNTTFDRLKRPLVATKLHAYSVKVIDQSGKVVQRSASEDFGFEFDLVWAVSRWRVRKIYTIS